MAGSGVSFTIILNPLIDDKSLTVTEKMVLISLLRYMNKDQQRSWPSTRLLAENLGLSQLWIRRTLNRLEEKGLIKSEKKAGCVTRYEVLTEKLSYAPNSVTRVTELHTPSNSVTQCRVTELRALSNSVTHTNTNYKNESTNTKDKYEGRLSSPDPWIADQLAVIHKVVTAPRPAKLPELLAQWRETYGARTVEQTIPKALRWMQDNERRYTDMGRFLGKWLGRDAEKPRVKIQRNKTPDYGDTPPSWRELLGGVL